MNWNRLGVSIILVLMCFGFVLGLVGLISALVAALGAKILSAIVTIAIFIGLVLIVYIGIDDDN